MRFLLGATAVALALVPAGGAGSTSANFNPGGVKIFPVEGVQFSGAVATFTDPGAPNNNYDANIKWGDGSESTQGRVVANGKNSTNDTIYDVTGQHTYAEEGTYELKIRITGGSGEGNSSPVAQVSDAPLTLKVAVPAVVEGGSASGVIATFTDLNTNEVVGAFTATIDWGSGPSAGTVARTGAGAFSISGTHTFGEEGQVTVGVTIKDVGGSTASETQVVTVGDAPLTAGAPITLRGTERKALNGAVATFHDGFAGAAATDFTATIDWGDGKNSTGTIAAVTGGWQVSGSHTYSDEGRHKTSVKVNDKGGATVTIPGAATIADAPLHAAGRNFVARVGDAFRGTVATFTDDAGKAPLSDYTVTIDWGDGRSSAGEVSRAGGRLAVIGTHTYAKAGSKVVTVRISDRGGARATAHSRAQVSA